MGEVMPEDRLPSAGRERTETAAGTHTATRQQLVYCPYCAEETLFPLERGWECRSCNRAFSITFLGLRPRAAGTPGEAR
jgi:rubredoxin